MRLRNTHVERAVRYVQGSFRRPAGLGDEKTVKAALDPGRGEAGYDDFRGIAFSPPVARFGRAPIAHHHDGPGIRLIPNDGIGSRGGDSRQGDAQAIIRGRAGDGNSGVTIDVRQVRVVKVLLFPGAAV